VDLNRPREQAVYSTPDTAWGLSLWSEPLAEAEIERSLVLYDRFYRTMAEHLDALAQQGPFVVLDIHSYNHRREGPDRPPAWPAENPEINIGTGSMDRDRWGHLVDRLMSDLAEQIVAGHHLDVRENVRFQGGHLCQWVHECYPESGCALAVELKKTFMDEWTGRLDPNHLDELIGAFRAAVPLLLGELACGVST
jgi:N-formylglutamate deformylase